MPIILPTKENLPKILENFNRALTLFDNHSRNLNMQSKDSLVARTDALTFNRNVIQLLENLTSLANYNFEYRRNDSKFNKVVNEFRKNLNGYLRADPAKRQECIQNMRSSIEEMGKVIVTPPPPTMLDRLGNKIGNGLNSMFKGLKKQGTSTEKDDNSNRIKEDDQQQKQQSRKKFKA